MAKLQDIEAVIFDLDGTAIVAGEHEMPSRAMIRAVAAAKPHFRLCAATGRGWRVGKAVIQALDLTDPCVIAGGTQIIDPVTEELLWQALIPEESADTVADFIRSHNYPFAYVKGTSSYYTLDSFKAADGVNTMYVLDVPKAGVDEALETLQRVPGVAVSPVGSWHVKDGMDLHVTSDTATKEHAVAELAGMIGVPTSYMLGVGDALNDIHLFNAVGHKVAMGNAVPALKEAADEVIAAVSEDGLAHYLDFLRSLNT